MAGVSGLFIYYIICAFKNIALQKVCKIYAPITTIISTLLTGLFIVFAPNHFYLFTFLGLVINWSMRIVIAAIVLQSKDIERSKRMSDSTIE